MLPMPERLYLAWLLRILKEFKNGLFLQLVRIQSLQQVLKVEMQIMRLAVADVRLQLPLP